MTINTPLFGGQEAPWLQSVAKPGESVPMTVAQTGVVLKTTETNPFHIVGPSWEEATSVQQQNVITKTVGLPSGAWTISQPEKTTSPTGEPMPSQPPKQP